MPPGTAVAEWDLAGPKVDTKDAPFSIAWPDENRLNLKRSRVVKAAGVVPAYGAVYQRGSFFVFVTAVQDAGSIPYGIPVEDGRLILGPDISSFNFEKDGTRYNLLGNVPYEELLEIADVINRGPRGS